MPLAAHPWQVELARRFSLGYERVMPDGRKWKETERVQAVQEASASYNRRLKNLGLRDYQVAHVLTHMTRGYAPSPQPRRGNLRHRHSRSVGKEPWCEPVARALMAHAVRALLRTAARLAFCWAGSARSSSR